MSMPQTVILKATRQDPELLRPAKSTPNELKELSILETMPELRYHASLIQVYRNCDLANGKDPAQVIKKAIEQALIIYYPFAGRLREIGLPKRLVVDCTGEGVMFTSADVNCSVDDFGHMIHPPFPGVDELLFHPAPISVTDAPLLHFQVTRFKCGGFVLGTNVNHVLSDGEGIAQFLRAVSDLARGFSTPSLLPVWERHLLRARDPPQVTFKHHEFDQEPDCMTPFFKRSEIMVDHMFLFDPPVISSLRGLIDIPYCSTFDLISAATWRARAISMKLDPTTDARFMFSVNMRNKFNPPVPAGYYGNLIVGKVVKTKMEKLMENPLNHAVEVIKKGKNETNEEYMRSSIDLAFSRRGSLSMAIGNTWLVTDIRRLRFHEIDYGWGKAAYGGFAKVNIEGLPGIISCFVPIINHKDKSVGIGVSISLPEPMMNSFVNELNIMMGRFNDGRLWTKTISRLWRWKI